MTRRQHRRIEAQPAITGPIGTAARVLPPRFAEFPEWRPPLPPGPEDHKA